MGKAQITIPLDIPDVRVLQTALGERGELIITIESTKKWNPVSQMWEVDQEIAWTG